MSVSPPADATVILAAVQAVIEGVSPDVPVLIRKRPPESAAGPSCGWQPGDKVPSWVLSISKEDTVDRFGSFEQRSVDYLTFVSYVRQFVPGVIDDDPAIRQLKKTIRDAVYKVGLVGASQVWGAPEWREGEPYRQQAAGDTLLQVSEQYATFHVMEPRT